MTSEHGGGGGFPNEIEKRNKFVLILYVTGRGKNPVSVWPSFKYRPCLILAAEPIWLACFIHCTFFSGSKRCQRTNHVVDRVSRPRGWHFLCLSHIDFLLRFSLVPFSFRGFRDYLNHTAITEMYLDLFKRNVFRFVQKYSVISRQSEDLHHMCGVRFRARHTPILLCTHRGRISGKRGVVAARNFFALRHSRISSH